MPRRLQAVDPSVRQGTIAERHIGEAGGRDLEMVVVGHHQVFHDALAGAHNVYRIGSLVGRDTEEVFGRELAEEVHQFLGLDVIVLNERLHAVPVFLAAHVLMGREVRQNVESPLLPENPRKDRIREIQRIAPELLRHIQSLRAPHIPHQLRKPVLIEVQHNHAPGLETQHRLNETRPDGARPADDAHLLALDLPTQRLGIRPNVRLEHTLRPERHAVRNESV